jgi:tRNA uridine 5-carboxymethylaminomethyl modification enzyme
MKFAEEWRLALEQTPNVDFWQEMITGITTHQGRITGVRTSIGIEIQSKSVVLTNGTFLNGIIHIGEKQFGGGRTGESAAKGITEQLVGLGFEAGRMKTGTPPRVDGRSLDYSKMEVQYGDENPEKFSYSDQTTSLTEQRTCWITYTNKDVHSTLEEGFDRSPMFNGRIQGLGPRYCPSIEDKINRFAERDRHQIFVEPEGWNTVEMYINGFSTSLPEDIQYKAMRKIAGFENAKMFRPGYAIEYDYFPPTQLRLTLETQLIENLYFAGQINGTTGYEEAASQGLIAGVNASLKTQEKDPFLLKRSDAYIGVLIDDLINKGTDEPYRMFTSRAEFRLLLRQDNADLRLTPMGNQIGLADDERLQKVTKKREETAKLINDLKQKKADPVQVNSGLDAIDSATIKEKVSLEKLLKRPQIGIQELIKIDPENADYFKRYAKDVLEQAEIQIKYDSYIEKEQQMVEKISNMENYKIPLQFDYKAITALSAEGKQKLSKVRPETLGQASRISGVSPADLSIITVYLGR